MPCLQGAFDRGQQRGDILLLLRSVGGNAVRRDPAEEPIKNLVAGLIGEDDGPAQAVAKKRGSPDGQALDGIGQHFQAFPIVGHLAVTAARAARRWAIAWLVLKERAGLWLRQNLISRQDHGGGRACKKRGVFADSSQGVPPGRVDCFSLINVQGVALCARSLFHARLPRSFFITL